MSTTTTSSSSPVDPCRSGEHLFYEHYVDPNGEPTCSGLTISGLGELSSDGLSISVVGELSCRLDATHLDRGKRRFLPKAQDSSPWTHQHRFAGSRRRTSPVRPQIRSVQKSGCQRDS